MTIDLWVGLKACNNGMQYFYFDEVILPVWVEEDENDTEGL